MTESAGENATQDGVYECVKCHSEIKMRKGQLLAGCAKCGGLVFELKRELGSRMTMNRKKPGASKEVNVRLEQRRA